MPAASVIVSALDEVGDRDAPRGSRPWAVWIVRQAKLRRKEAGQYASLLGDLVVRMQKYEAWKVLGMPSFEALCTTQLRLSPDEVSAVLKAGNGQKLGAVLRRVGRPKAGEGNVDNINNSGSGGTDPAYLAARLRRDHPEAIFDESVRGSVRQAAIAAGIVKIPSTLEALRKAWAKASAKDRQQFLKELGYD